jgi:hypothetical protein
MAGKPRLSGWGPGPGSSECTGRTDLARGKGDGMNDRTEEIFGAPMSSYSRLQAIEDGVLVDLMQPGTVELVREAGFKFPLAMTASAFAATVARIGEELPAGQDIQGRLWDVLWMLKCATRRTSSTDRLSFEVRVWNGCRHEVVRLWSVCGPGDNEEPVITIILEGED